MELINENMKKQETMRGGRIHAMLKSLNYTTIRFMVGTVASRSGDTTTIILEEQHYETATHPGTMKLTKKSL